jgi:hypothetical protein
MSPEAWIAIAVSLIGSVGGAYLGVKLAVTKLQTEMTQVMKEIESLRSSRHQHANLIQDHEARLNFLERQR